MPNNDCTAGGGTIHYYGSGLALPLLGSVGTDALAGELEDGGVVDEPIDGGHGRHGVLEDLIPLGEDQVGGDDDGLLLVTLSEEMEEYLHLLGRLLDVADVVDDEWRGLIVAGGSNPREDANVVAGECLAW